MYPTTKMQCKGTKMDFLSEIANALSKFLSKVAPTPSNIEPQETEDSTPSKASKLVDRIPSAYDAIQEVAEIPAVNITINKQVRNKYKRGWIRKIRKTNKPIVEITLHGTAGGTSTTGLLRWMYNGARAKLYYKGIALFHYLVGRNGELVEVIDPEYWVYHSQSGRHDKQTIGIELINPDKMNSGSYTEAQYKALFELIFDHLMPLYPTINKISTHRYNVIVYNRGRISAKQCPGTGFDFSRLSKELEKRLYNYKSDGQLRYNIKKK